MPADIHTSVHSAHNLERLSDGSCLSEHVSGDTSHVGDSISAPNLASTSRETGAKSGRGCTPIPELECVSGRFVFGGYEYKLSPGAEALGSVPGGVLHWVKCGNDDSTAGIAFIIRNRAGSPINILHLELQPDWQQDSPEEFLVGHSLAGGHITFKGIYGYMPTFITENWKDALLLNRRTGSTAIACLSLENLPVVVKEWLEDHPNGELHVCFNGTDNECDNPQLRTIFKSSEHTTTPSQASLPSRAPRNPRPQKLMRAPQTTTVKPEKRVWLVPAGASETFGSIDAKLGKEGLLAHLERQRALNAPWPLEERHPQLNVVPLPLAWPAPIRAAFLIEQLRTTIRRYVVLSDRASTLLCVWVIMTYATAAFRHIALLGVTAPEPACGRTTLLCVLQFVCKRALGMRGVDYTSITRGAGSGNRKYQYDRASETLLIDDAQAVFSDAQVLARLESCFDTFELGVITKEQDGLAKQKRRGACAFAYEEKSMPSRLASRCVHIDMQRQGPGDQNCSPEDLLTDAQSELTLLRAMIRRWVEDNHERILSFAIPSSVAMAPSRRADVWRALLKIAYCISQSIGDQLYVAASEFTVETEETDAGRALLGNINELLVDCTTPFIASTDLCEKLLASQNWPWKSKALNTTALASFLRRYDVRPKMKRIEGKSPLRSYNTQDLKTACERYLRPV